MVDPTARAAAITEIQSILLRTAAVEDFVDGVAQAAARQVGPATSATITLRRDGRPRLIGASDDRAAQCDEVEYAADDGPCLEAIATGGLVHVPDVAAETRWPSWCAATAANGFG